MRHNVTVVPSDRCVIVEGQGLRFDFTAPSNLHALQWHGNSGHMEWTDEPNSLLTLADYEADVQPFVQLWEVENARLEALMAAQEAEYNSLPRVKERKLAVIKSGYDAALIATLTMPTSPEMASAAETAAQAALFAAEDSAGLVDVLAILNTRRQELEAAVSAAQTVEDVQTMAVSYPV